MTPPTLKPPITRPRAHLALAIRTAKTPCASFFEQRLAAVICVDGLYDAYAGFTSGLPPALMFLLAAYADAEVNRSIEGAMAASTQLRWTVEQGRWSFKAASAAELLARTRGMSLGAIADKVTCPVLVCDAEDDRFFGGRARQLADALGARHLSPVHRRGRGGGALLRRRERPDEHGRAGLVPRSRRGTAGLTHDVNWLPASDTSR